VNAWGPYRPPTWQHPVGWGTLHETPPVITAPVVRERPGDFVFNGVLRPAWAYRLELALVALVWAAHYLLTAHLGRYAADRLVVAAAIVVGLVNWTRDPLARALFRSHLRRRWALACRHANLATRNDRVPRITRSKLTRAGEQLRVRVPAGGQVPDLEAEAERLAAFLDAREVRVTREPDSARHARVVVIRRDPLADRTVGLPRFVAEELAAHLAGLGDAEAFVFTAPQGGPLRLPAFRARVWRPAVIAAGLDGLRIHDCGTRRWRCGSRPAPTPRGSRPGRGTPR
jgi:hypothetical protein